MGRRMKGQYREDVCDVCDGLGYIEDLDDEDCDVACPECRGRGRKAYFEAKEKGE